MKTEPLLAQPLFSPAAERLIRLPEVKRRTSLGRSTIYAMMAKKMFPDAIRLGKRFTVWKESSVNARIASHSSGASTGDTDARCV